MVFYHAVTYYILLHDIIPYDPRTVFVSYGHIIFCCIVLYLTSAAVFHMMSRYMILRNFGCITLHYTMLYQHILHQLRLYTFCCSILCIYVLFRIAQRIALDCILNLNVLHCRVLYYLSYYNIIHCFTLHYSIVYYVISFYIAFQYTNIT